MAPAGRLWNGLPLRGGLHPGELPASLDLGGGAGWPLFAAAAGGLLLTVTVAAMLQRRRPPLSQPGDEREEHGTAAMGASATGRPPPRRGLRLTIRKEVAVIALLALAAAVVWADFLWRRRLEAARAAHAAEHAGAGYQCTPLSPEERLRHFGRLEGYSHEIATPAAAAQRHFDQGLVLLYNFNQREANVSFTIALELDPSCAMCHWGLAYAAAPFLNKVASPQDVAHYPAYGPSAHRTAQAASQHALSLATAALEASPDSSAAQRDMRYIRALQVRFGPDAAPGAGYLAAERRYAAAMEAVAEAEPQLDADALVLAAEALLNTAPWDYYTDRHGAIKPDAARARGLLERALRHSPRHPMALHLMVHLTEQLPAGQGPGRAGEGERAADELNTAQPGMGHLIHMASHMYMRVGRYGDGVRNSALAIKRDAADALRCLAPYGPEHNTDMLIMLASMNGEYSTAAEYAALERRYAEGATNPGAKFPGMQWTNLFLLQTRYAMWPDVLAAPPPPAHARGASPHQGLEFATAMWRFGRLLALAARASDTTGAALPSATVEQLAAVDEAAAAFRTASAHVNDTAAVTLPAPRWKSGGQIGLYGGGYRYLLDVAERMVAGRLATLRGDWAGAVAALAEGAEMEAEMEYMEPIRVHQPIRQCLGKVLLDAGRHEDAEDCYRKDLSEYPANAWSLLGLAHSLAGQGRASEAASAITRHKRAWAQADDRVANMRSSCPSFAGVFRA
eukprot:jgi/Tetstr1/442481/TSEL_030581.t1